MNISLLIAISAGLASALLFSSQSTGSLIAIVLTFFTPLPIVIAAMGWGIVHGVTAAVSGALALLLFYGSLKIPGGYLLLFVAPYLLLSHFAYLSRTVTGGAMNASNDNGVEWYPTGRLIIWMATLSALLASFAVLYQGLDMATYKKSMSPQFDIIVEILKKSQEVAPTPAEIEQIKDLLALYLPISLGSSLFLLATVNFWLGSWIVHRSGMLRRPWPQLISMEYPSLFLFSFAAFLAVALIIPGMPRLLALTFSTTFFAAFVLLGLAVIHAVTRHIEIRFLILFSVYLCLLFL